MSKLWIVSVLLVLVAATVEAQDENNKVTVETNYGPVVGRSFQLHTGNTVNAFLSIPFARPPVEDLRWRDPEDPEPWTEPLDAVTLRPACIQNLVNDIMVTHPGWNDYSEDCLHLSIYTPGDMSQGPYPVMMWIHGGANKVGSQIIYPGYFLADKDVVVVVPNYRLNVFGFGTTKDAAAPGNYGLKDQIQALRFIQDNIAAFGGDPEHVTVAGESAGGLNSGLLLVSPLSEDLFHQAILQSGSELAPWGISTEDDTNYMIQTGEELNCPTEDSNELIDCLRTKSSQRILRANITCAPGYDWVECQNQVVIDGTVLPDTPINLRRSGNYQHVPEMIGILSEDGFLFMPPNTWTGLTREEFEASTRDFIHSLAPSFPDPDRMEDVTQAILFQYTPWPVQDDRAANRDAIGRAKTDYAFGAPADYQAKLHAEDGNDVYFYVYNIRSNTTNQAEWRGCAHAMELEMVFGYPLLKFNEEVYNHTGFGKNVNVYDESDVEVAEFIIELWSNFVKFGNPTPSQVATHSNAGAKEVTWPLFTSNAHEYMWLGMEEVEARSNYRQDYYAFMQYYFRFLAYGDEKP